MVTDWERVDKDDFYLTKKWEKNGGKENIKEAKKLQQEGHLYIAYIVTALSYAIYAHMDASQIFINEEGDKVLQCESAIIGNNHTNRWEHHL